MQDLSNEVAAIQAAMKILPRPHERLETWLTLNSIPYPLNSTINRILWTLDDEQLIRLSKALQSAILRERGNERSQTTPMA